MSCRFITHHLCTTLAWCVAVLCMGTASAAATSSPAIALHYGAQPPIDELQAFDWVVLEPSHTPDPTTLPQRHTQWFAYVSVGELDTKRDYATAMPTAWLRGHNAAWASHPIDHAAAGWPGFFAERIVGPLWEKGWRGFFLDTLDAHHLFAKTPPERQAQEDALVTAIEALHARFPGIRLIANRGFEILPRLKGRVQAVVAESLFRGWDAATQSYVQVSASDHDWLLAQLRRVKDELQVPVAVIDYVPWNQRALARDTAARIRALGLLAWVSTPALDVLGVGDVEVQPRRIALLTDLPPDTGFQQSVAYRYLAAPLHWLGYIIDVYNVQDPLPEHLLQGRHAALVSWFSQPVTSLNAHYPAWLKRQIDGGLRLVLMHQSGLEPNAPLLRELGFSSPTATVDGAVTVATQAPWVGFEAPVPLVTRLDAPMRWEGNPHERNERALQLRTAQGSTVDAVGITPWGGYALEPYAVRLPALSGGARWIVNPVEFLRRAMGMGSAQSTESFPVPDVTTEGGKRLLLVHIDGDGFVSRAERAGSPFAGEVLLNQVITRYRIPHTASIIQGEIAGNGLYKDLAPQLERIARRLFNVAHVELASHSYSHPFFWSEASGHKAPYGLHLQLPGYTFNLKDEIDGSIHYINTQLAPPHKRTRVFLWTGDTEPTAQAVAQTDTAGVLNMNGGDTLITNSEPTWTAVAGLGLLRNDAQGLSRLHVFAPHQNENVYTNLWSGPFYGYTRAIETFTLTETPLRFKPINIYYHVYSVTKAASLTALHRVYAWALSQAVVPVYASDYILKVQDFHHMVIARDWRAPQTTWRIRSQGQVRTVRLPERGPLSLRASRNVAGVSPGPQARYVHLTAADADLVLAPEPHPPVHVTQAGGWLDQFSRDAQGMRFGLSSYTPASLHLAAATGCRVFLNEREARPAATPGDTLHITLADHEVSTTPHHVLVHVRCAH